MTGLQFLDIKTSDGSQVPVTLSTTAPWLTIQRSTPVAPVSIGLAANANGLTPGTYTGTVSVLAAGAANSGATVGVTFVVVGPAPSAAIATPASLTFTTLERAARPGSQIIQISSLTPVNFDVSTSDAWLTVGRKSGTTPSSIVVDVQDPGYGAGTYTGAVRISVFPSTVLSVPVTWIVERGAPKMYLSNSNLTMYWQRGSPLPSPLSFAVATGGTEQASQLRVNGGWFTAAGNLDAGLSWIKIQLTSPALALMAAGTYSGSVEIQLPGANFSLPAIPIQIRVSDDPFPQISANPFVFSYAPGGEVPPTQTRTVAPASTGLDVSVSVTTGGGSWLSVSLDKASTPAKLVVQTRPADLALGDYTAMVSVKSGKNSVEIPVALRVTAQPRIRAYPAEVELSARNATVDQTVQVVSTKANQPYTLITLFPDRNGIRFTPVGSATPGQLTVQATPTDLPPGSYSTSILVWAPGADNPLLEIPVRFKVEPSTVVETQPIQTTFPITVGEVSTLSKTMRLNTPTPIPYEIDLLADGGPWLSVTPMKGMTNSNIELSLTAVAATLKPGYYGTTISISSNGVRSGAGYVGLSVAEAGPMPKITGLVSAASYQGGVVSPGMLVTLAGVNFGPVAGVSGQLIGGRFTTTAGGCSVAFDGLAAPMLYANATQINAIVPYGVSGKTSSQVVTQCGGARSEPWPVSVEASVPGIFTADGAQAAAFNEDGLYNSPSQPARAGSIMTVFATGEGVVTPGAQDGEVINPTALRRPVAPVVVRVNGVELPASDVLYAGSAPGLVSGLMQVNFRLPASVTNQPRATLELWVGNRRSAPGVTIAVR